jgi:hypothetical protein
MDWGIFVAIFILLFLKLSFARDMVRKSNYFFLLAINQWQKF